MDRSRPGWKHFWRQNGWKKPSELALFNCRAPSWLVSLIYIYIDLFIDEYIYIFVVSFWCIISDSHSVVGGIHLRDSPGLFEGGGKGGGKRDAFVAF